MDPTTGTGMDPSAMAATPASMMSGMPTSASPTSGTPASGMGAQQPQSAGASPMSSGSGANPLVDSLGQLADSATGDGKGDGDKLTPERLEELLKEAGLTDKDGDGKGLDLDGDGKPDHNSTPDGKHAPTGPAATDLYGSANTNPGLNNPAPPAHLASPSPAMPSTTATPSPSTLAVPMTELSHDVNPVGAGTNGPSGNPPAAGNPSPNTAAAAAGGSPGVLGAYPTGAAPGGPMMGPMTPMAPMGGMGAMGAMGGAPAGSASPAPIVAAAVPPAVAEPPASGRSHPAPPPPRVSALPPEHALAEMHLASLVRVYTDAGWAGTTIAVGVVDDGSGAPRYVMATSDGLSLVPMGVAVPAGLEVLGVWAANDLGFHRDWGGYRRAGRKLIAWTDSRPQLRLSYLVSNDTGTAPTTADGSVTEVQQTVEEQKRLAGGSPAITPRSQIPGLAGAPIEAKAAAGLKAVIQAWGHQDVAASDMAAAKVRVMSARWTDIRDRDPEVPAITATYLAAEGLAALASGRRADAAASLAQLLQLRPYGVPLAVA